MKRLLLGVGALLFATGLSACTDGKITPAETVLTGCQTYNGLLATANELDKQGQLSPSQVEGVSMSIDLADPICGGPAPKVDATALEVVKADSAVEILKVITGQK
jgi:hypothetical protein